jgi:hypothetical protein
MPMIMTNEDVENFENAKVRHYVIVNLKKIIKLEIMITSVRTDLGDLSSGGRFHERAAQYLQGVGPNVISRFNNGLSVF